MPACLPASHDFELFVMTSLVYRFAEDRGDTIPGSPANYDDLVTADFKQGM